MEFLQQLEEDSGETPKALQNRPIVFEWMREYVDAFVVLTNKRSSGFGPGPIPLSEIESYIRLFGCTDVMTLVKMVSRMDAAYLEELSKVQRIAK